MKLTVPDEAGRTLEYVAPLRKGFTKVAVDLPSSVAFGTVTLFDASGRTVGQHRALLLGCSGPWRCPMQTEAKDSALGGPALQWLAAPEVEPVHVLATGEGFLRLRLHVTTDETSAAVQVRVRDRAGRLLRDSAQTFSRLTAVADAMLYYEWAHDWPDRVVVEMTLYDVYGHVTDTRTTETDVVHHRHSDDDADEGPSVWTRHLLFAVLPFLVGFLAVSIVRRRLRR
jgi:hypothetical protein